LDRSAAGDAREAELQRILTPIAKYWLCKRVTPVALEAMECLGGNGYVEESSAARLYREAPLNGIWEGSANVICLDVLRALNRSRDAFSALVDEIEAAGDPRIRQVSERAARSLADPAMAEPAARSIVEALAICTQASLMKRFADPIAGEAFCVSRLEAPCGARTLGTLAAVTDFGAIIEGARLRISVRG
jgi:putative acyl-CoA dehydrogenase